MPPGRTRTDGGRGQEVLEDEQMQVRRPIGGVFEAMSNRSIGASSI